MPKLVIGNFGGAVPRTTGRMLRDHEAQLADNVRLYAGELSTWFGPKQEYVPETPAIETIYRLRNELLQQTTWLVWDSLVNVAVGPIADLEDIRLYYTGDGAPKKTNWALATGGSGDGPHSYLNLGVPAPTIAPTVATNAAGSAAAQDTRAYVYTYVSEFGGLTEESAPSPPSELVTVEIGESVDISAFEVPPVVDHNITKIRVYRTLAGAETVGTYAYVTDVDVAFLPTTANDDLAAEALGEPLQTVGWTPPPDTLQGITSMANGMLAGFRGNTIYFCEPYFPHAWPTRYAQTVPEQIVGLGAYGNTLVVLTEGFPYVMTGLSPETISVEKLPIPEPCVSAPSIASDQFGVVYASPNGLVAIGPGQAALITTNLFRRDEWQEYAPHTLEGAVYDGKYFGAFQSSEHGTRTMVLSRDDHPALSFLSIYAGAMHTDINESQLYYYNPKNQVVYAFHKDPLRPVTYEWKSKRFQLPKAITFSAMRLAVDAQQQDQTAVYLSLIEDLKAENRILFEDDTLGEINAASVHEHTVNGDTLHDLPEPADLLTATVILYGDRGEQKAALTVSSIDPIRVPPFRSRELEVRISGTVNVSTFEIATTAAELKEP